MLLTPQEINNHYQMASLVVAQNSKGICGTWWRTRWMMMNIG